MPTHAFINRDVLRWARLRRGLTMAEAAASLEISGERWAEWENGTERPTFRQAQALARHLSIPFGYLFLAKPPAEALELPDLRTLAGRPPLAPSPELVDVVSDAIYKQRWYREHLEEEGADEISFIGRYSEDYGDWDQIALEIRNTFGINTTLRRQSSGWEDFLRRLIRRVEDLGIIVLRNSVVGSNNHRTLDVEEFRGFAISDSLAPLIFINSHDSLSAQNFTLVHEIAHMWVGSSGISNPDYRRSFSEQANTTENMCNYLAAESLVPGRELQSYWNSAVSSERNIRDLSRTFRVSPLVVLRRAYDLMRIAREEYREIYAIIYGNRSRITDESNRVTGGNFYSNLLSKNSRTLTEAVISALEVNRVSHKEASELLGVHFGTLDGIYRHLQGGTGSA